MIPPPDETVKQGGFFIKIYSKSELKPGDVIRIWKTGKYGWGWIPNWWWCEVTSITEDRVYFKDLKSGKEGSRLLSDTIRSPYGVTAYKHSLPERVKEMSGTK
jgi:hypothetical protein